MQSATPAITLADLNPSDVDATYRKLSLRILPFLFICYVLGFIDRVNISFAHLEFSADIGLSEAAYGFGVGLFFVGYILFEVPSNLCLQRFGARVTISRIMILWGLISTCMMFVQTPMQFYVARIALGCAEAGFLPGVILYLTYWYPSGRRARVTSRFILGIAAAGTIGGIVSGWIMHNMGGVYGLKAWQWLFLLEGSPSIVAGVIAYFYLADKPEQAKWLSPAEKAIVQAHLAEDASAKAAVEKGHDFSAALRNPWVYIAAFGYFVIPWAGSVLNFWAPTLIKQSGVTNVWYIGLLSALPWMVGAVGMLIVCWNSDRVVERRWHFMACILVVAGAVAAIGYLPSNWTLSIVLLSIMCVGYLSVTALFWTIPTAFLSGTAAAGGIALISSLGQVGGLTAPIVIGWVRGATGSLSWGMYTVALVLIVGGLTILLGIPRRMLRENKAK